MPTIVSVIDSGGGYTTVKASDGKTYTLKGKAAWRNNNPGNLRPGSLTNNLGAIGVSHAGTNGDFLVFPDPQTGLKAQQALQFTTPKYANKSIADAIAMYAPAGDNNNPAAYAARLAAAAGVPVTTKLRDLTPQQQAAYIAAQHGVENNQAGSIVDQSGNSVDPRVFFASAPPSDFSTMAQANINAAAMPPLPIPRPQTPTGGQVRGANTGTIYKVGDLIPSKDGVHTLRVVDKGNGVAGFEQVRSPFDIPGVVNVSREMNAPTIVGQYIRDAMKNMPKPDLAPVAQTVQQAAGTTQATVGGALKQGQDALGNLGNSAVNMFGNLFNAQKTPTPPAAIPPRPSYVPTMPTGGPGTFSAAPQTPPVASPYVPAMPTGGPGTFAPSGLPAAPYMPTMPIGGPGTFGAGSMPAAPMLPQALPQALPQIPRQIGTPPGTQLRMTVNRAPSPPPVQMATIATGKRVPVGTVTPHGGVVQSDGSINHGSWSTPGPGEPLTWWQANSMGYTV